ncbi:MAG: MBL fold metallo-hydrolase [Xanthomonadales bacterium]|nr:MBL fold metallo-hydrolase [Gammaproteobacteria bacterium]MBT8053600.1 MBL fold metallo-hydrolase [Gammaproteobacteria bacterium]NND58622.1 MBL fold metallo-hydrolase [Xanthomonadales bacterium]NNK50988.1 MBL fold metallo-hydrolase [Xanthomonadales bacterium]
MQLKVASQWYETRPCSDGITLIWELHVSRDLCCNIWHVRGRDRDLLIDSGLGVVSLRESVPQLSGRQLLAVASHSHFDHIGCHHEFEHRLCHPAEAHVMCIPDNQANIWSDYRASIDESEVLQALPYDNFSFDNYSVVPAPPTRLIDEGDEVDLGDRLLRVFHMPGHSPGSICLYESASETLFTGDVLYDGELLDSLRGSDPEVYSETLARLREIPAKVFHCGHFGSFGRERMNELIDAYEFGKRS